MTSDLALARQLLETEGLAFVLVREGRVIARGGDHGVAELLSAVDRLGGEVRGASLADKVVGKAVALIVARGEICAVDTPLASEAAALVLKSRGVALQAATVVPLILNRRGDGPCPLEQLTQPFEEPEPALVRLREFFAAKRTALPTRID
jgi:hypothetical protein